MTIGNTLISTSSVQPGILPFDQYGRYQMMREALDAARPLIGGRLRVLDVGGFFRGLDGVALTPASLFLPDDDVTILDQVPLQPGDDLPGYIQGDGRSLDFPDGAFDFVISCDTLEHVPASNRPDFWRELLRVARCGVLLAAPFSSPEVVAAEDLLFHYIQAELGVEQQQLKEHAAYGLPRLESTRTLLDTQGLEYRVYPSGDVHAWLVMMLLKHYLLAHSGNLDLHRQVDAYYTRFFASNERREPAYRHMFAVAHQNHTAAWLEEVHTALTPTLTVTTDENSALWPGLVAGLSQFVCVRATTSILPELTKVVATQHHTIETLQHSLTQRDTYLRNLEQRARWLEEQANAAQHELAAIKQGRMLRLLTWLQGLWSART
jgi:hypothetical protein